MFLTYIHNFRGIAIIYIVAGHCFSAFNWENNPVVAKLTKILLMNGTIFFVFIAGYLFQYLSKNYALKKYFFVKLTTVLLPYLLVSIPAIVFFVFFQERETVWTAFYDDPPWLQILHFYLYGLHLAPFWFIPMIFLFYLVSPILIILDNYKWTYLFLPLLILLSCSIPRGDTFQSFVHFFSVYFFGMFCSHYREIVNAELIKPMIFSLLILLYILLIYIEFLFFDNVTFTNINFIRKLFLCCIFMALLLKFNIHNKILSFLAKVSFGIYFIHSYIISVFKMAEEYFVGYYLQGNILSLIFFMIAVLLICIAVILGIKKIFGAKSRYLIGY
jgi:peptidoglycan/LPS O-acetylase OafA/YrhL